MNLSSQWRDQRRTRGGRARPRPLRTAEFPRLKVRAASNPAPPASFRRFKAGAGANIVQGLKSVGTVPRPSMPMHLPKPAPRAVRLFEEFAPERTGVAARKMFGQPCAFVNGNMFFGVLGEDVFVRLSECDRARASKIHGFDAFEPVPGRPMREYFVLPKSILEDRTKLRQWVARSLSYASSLPPKKSKPPRK